MRQTRPAPKFDLSSVIIRELKTKADWESAYPLVHQQNKDMLKKQYFSLLTKMRRQGYRCIGAFSGKRLLGICGFWVGYRFWCDKYIALDNVVVDQHIRSKGLGHLMAAWVEEEGQRQGCKLAELDSYTTAHKAHRFYFREGYCILGYHFVKYL